MPALSFELFSDMSLFRKPTLSCGLSKTLFLFVLVWPLSNGTKGCCVSPILALLWNVTLHHVFSVLPTLWLWAEGRCSKRERERDGWAWERLRKEGCAEGEDCGLIKRDGGLKMEEFLGTHMFVRVRLGQEDDGCEDETASVSEGWELLASSSVCLFPHCQAWWKIQSSSASSGLRRAFQQIERLSQPIDLSPCWKHYAQMAIWEVTNLHFLSLEWPEAL